jgi:hypothetical protein
MPNLTPDLRAFVDQLASLETPALRNDAVAKLEKQLLSFLDKRDAALLKRMQSMIDDVNREMRDAHSRLSNASDPRNWSTLQR